MKNDKLHNINSSGFKTPDNYFESFENKILNEISDKVITKHVESAGFSVPKDYFETIDNAVLNKINSEEKPVIKLRNKTTLYYVAGIAASFILLFGLVFNTNKTVTMDALDTASIENYLFQQEYSNDELATLFLNSEISETDFIDVTISDETLNQYLENVDTEDLLFE